MDTITLNSKTDDHTLTVIDDCIMSMTGFYLPVVSVSEDQLGIIGNTIISLEVLIEKYMFPMDKVYDVLDHIKKTRPDLFTLIEFEKTKEQLLKEAADKMDEESGVHSEEEILDLIRVGDTIEVLADTEKGIKAGTRATVVELPVGGPYDEYKCEDDEFRYYLKKGDIKKV